MSSRARRLPLFVSDHGSPDVVGEASFQTPSGFAGSFTLSEFGGVVGVTAAAARSDLGDGDGVQSGVELAVAASGEAVSSLVGAGYLDGRRSGVVGERRRGGEPSGPTGSPDQTTGGDCADADGAGQGAARSCDEFADLLGIGFE